MNEPPVRLCCGQRHWGAQCPDGKVLCCICFGRFEISELSIDEESGKPCDVCKPCQEREDNYLKDKKCSSSNPIRQSEPTPTPNQGEPT